MAPVNRRSGSSTNAEQARRNAAAAERRRAAAAARQAAARQQSAALERRRDSFTGTRRDSLMRNYNGGANRDLNRLANGGGNSTTRANRDGSQTTTRRNGNVEQSLTTRGGLGGRGAVRFEQTTTRRNGTGSTTQRYNADRDLFGRTSSTQSSETSVTRRGATETRSRSTATDTRGRRTVTESTGTSRERNGVTTSQTRGTVRGQGTRQNTRSSETVTRNADVTTTRGRTSTTGTATTRTDRQVTTENGRARLGSSFDRRTENRVGGSYERLSGTQRPQDTSVSREDRGTRAQGVADAVNGLGVPRHDLITRREETDTSGLTEARRDRPTFAGAFTGTQSAQHLDVGVNGASGRFMRGASAGVYAQTRGRAEGRLGTAEGTLSAHAEARASVDATGTLNSNGLTASATARASVSAEASATGSLTSRPARFLGEDLTVGVTGTARVRAEATAEATGGVRVQRNPPTAVVEGSAGVSAVVRAEAEVTASAGPFSVRATGYASAGAEARASGVIGYEDGRLRIGGSVGAALGVGLGGSAQVEVDVAQIGRMGVDGARRAGRAAHAAADRDGDGRLSMNDVRAGARQATQAAHRAADRDGDGRLGLNDVRAGASQAVSAATSTVANAGRRVASFFGW